MNLFEKISDDKLKCTLCPRGCELKSGQRGFCHIRKNTGEKIELLAYGRTTGLAIDPIEKKPLYHFYPNSTVLSFGTTGCNMGCLFCQNYTTTKAKVDESVLQIATPEQIVGTALKYNCKSIAFTYNEPIIFMEYAVNTAKLAHQYGLKTIAVTAGYINNEPRKEFFGCMDAVNIDLKGFSKEFYKKYSFADFDKILDTIKYACNETDCHVELTTLLIEGENSADEMIKKECEWIVENLGCNIPLHFSAFHPAWRVLDKPRTSLDTLLCAYNIAKSFGINYVYTGNLLDTKTSTTYCKNCGNPIIVRDGFKVTELNLDKNGRCACCQNEVDVVI